MQIQYNTHYNNAIVQICAHRERFMRRQLNKKGKDKNLSVINTLNIEE